MTASPTARLKRARLSLRWAIGDLQDREDAPIEALRTVLAWVEARLGESEEGESNG